MRIVFFTPRADFFWNLESIHLPNRSLKSIDSLLDSSRVFVKRKLRPFHISEKLRDRSKESRKVLIIIHVPLLSDYNDEIISNFLIKSSTLLQFLSKFCESFVARSENISRRQGVQQMLSDSSSYSSRRCCPGLSFFSCFTMADVVLLVSSPFAAAL